MQVVSFPVGLFQCNCSLLLHSDNRTLVVVDPGDEVDLIWEQLQNLGGDDFYVSDLWHTHAHLDHIMGTRLLYERLCERCRDRGEEPPRIGLHPEDRWLYDNASMQAQFLNLPAIEVTSPTYELKAGAWSGDWSFLRNHHTPGHTPGSCCLELREQGSLVVPRSQRAGYGSDFKKLLFAGDTLFRRSVGRTDLWGGDQATLVSSIRGKLWSLSDETLVIPGHGPLTQIGEEKEKNPYVGLQA